jgi:hypothetical protein
MRIALLLVLVLAPVATAAGASEPLRASRQTIVFGRAVILFGQFTNRLPDQTVILRAKEYGDSTYTTVGVETTKSVGRWQTVVMPTIATKYEARTVSEVSAPLEIHVRPHVSLKRRGGRFVVRVISTASYEDRFVLIQRRSGRAWKRIARVAVSRTPGRFEVPLPRGVSRVRAYLPRSQAGRGYVAGISPAVVVRR